MLVACGPFAGVTEKPCRPGCVDDHTQLICDAEGVASSAVCPDAPDPCAVAHCSQGVCGQRPAVGAVCGSKGLARCNEGFACLGPDLQLSAAYDHTCAVADDGKIWCWGQNNYRQVGDGSDVLFRTSPEPVRGLPKRAIAVSAGFTHSCALVEGGAAYCWGDNNFGKADPASSDRILVEARAVPVPGIQFSAIRAAYSHTCALATDGTVFCWGATDSGQCGVDPAIAGVTQVGPTRIPNLDQVTFIETVTNHACAVRKAAPSLVCWGDNRYLAGRDDLSHKLGPNAAGLKYSATPVSVDVAGEVLGVGMGYDTTYAVGSDGRTYAFGLNTDGRLGTGSTAPVVPEPSPVMTRDALGVLAPLMGIPEFVRSGAANQCVKADVPAGGRRYLCWGTDQQGELGLGPPVGQTRRYATETTVLPLEANKMVHGSAHACVTIDTEEGTNIWCYGQGRLVGNGSMNNNDSVVSPVAVVWDPQNLEGVK